jgi:hypothetical protein
MELGPIVGEVARGRGVVMYESRRNFSVAVEDSTSGKRWHYSARKTNGRPAHLILDGLEAGHSYSVQWYRVRKTKVKDKTAKDEAADNSKQLGNIITAATAGGNADESRYASYSSGAKLPIMSAVAAAASAATSKLSSAAKNGGDSGRVSFFAGGLAPAVGASRKGTKHRAPSLLVTNGIAKPMRRPSVSSDTPPDEVEEGVPEFSHQIRVPRGDRHPTLCVVACDLPYAQGNSDAWLSMVESGDLTTTDLTVHIGDQVYADGTFANAVALCTSMVDKHGSDILESMYEGVFQGFANLYRFAWMRRAPRICLANTINMMVGDDHEVNDGFYIGKYKKGTLEAWVAAIASDVYAAYQQSLLLTHHTDARAKPRSLRDIGPPKERWGFVRRLGGHVVLHVTDRVYTKKGACMDKTSWNELDKTMAMDSVSQLVLVFPTPPSVFEFGARRQTVFELVFGGEPSSWTGRRVDGHRSVQVGNISVRGPSCGDSGSICEEGRRGKGGAQYPHGEHRGGYQHGYGHRKMACRRLSKRRRVLHAKHRRLRIRARERDAVQVLWDV